MVPFQDIFELIAQQREEERRKRKWYQKIPWFGIVFVACVIGAVIFFIKNI